MGQVVVDNTLNNPQATPPHTAPASVGEGRHSSRQVESQLRNLLSIVSYTK